MYGGLARRSRYGHSAAAGAALKYLGLTDAQLRAQLQAGKSLARVAGERQKSVDGLKSTIDEAVKSLVRDRLDAAVAAKRIPPAQESRIISNFCNVFSLNGLES